MPDGSTHLEFVDHIKSILGTVDGIGVDDSGLKAKILERPRNVDDMDEIEDAFVAGTPARINAWLITRERVFTSRAGVPGSHEHRFHTYLVRGYLSVEDSNNSDDTFQLLINRIFDKFLPTLRKKTVGATAIMESTDTIDCRIITTVSFVGHLVHFCEISFTFRERIQGVTYN